jgi:phosphatidylserine/phosphatidylglycerophosphate/cardiolipin synthase-like enzyme
MPRDGESQALLLTLARRIADGALKVRLHTDGRIHAKLTLIGYPTGRQIAIVGSSNLTLGGPAHPTEMNVVVRDPESITDLAVWYDALWDTSQDFHRELFDELGQCWAMRPLPLSGRATV